MKRGCRWGRFCVVAAGMVLALAGPLPAAVPYLEYNFNGGSTGSVANGTVISDMSGHNNHGMAVADGSGLYKVVSPIPSPGVNYAMRWPADGDQSYVQSYNPVPNPAATFSNGASLRVVVSIDALPPAYEHIAYLRWAEQGIPLFGFRYVGYGANYLDVLVFTGAGVAGEIAEPVSDIETKLGLGAGGLPGTPLVLMMTWSRANSNLAVYANGQLMASLTTNILADALASSTPDNLVVGAQKYIAGSSHKCVMDEVKVWTGALTADEVMADYRTMYPATGAVSAAAVPFLEYNFNDGTTGAVENFSVTPDVTGHGYDAYNEVAGSGLYKIVSPSPVQGTNYAMRWPTNNEQSYVYSAANVPNPAVTFSNGASLRAMVSVDSLPPVASYTSHWIAHLRWAEQGVDLFGLKYVGYWDEFLDVLVFTGSGATGEILVPVSDIETMLGLGAGGLPGKPLVLTMTWSPVFSTIMVYANGKLVGSTTASNIAYPLASATPTSFVVGGQRGYAKSRAGVIDDVKVWTGVLTADEVKADYRTIFPLAAGTVITIR